MSKLPYPFKLSPYKHQLDTWEKTRRNKYWAYLFDMGTGKSKLTLDVAAYMYDQGWIDALLIFGNKGSYSNWITEHVPEHLANHVPYKIAIWRAEANKSERDTLDKFLIDRSPDLKIFIMNIEALSCKRSSEVALAFARSRRTLSIIDESTTIKNPTAARTKMAWRIRDVSTARRILTGSVIDNRPLDAWAQYEFLAKGILGHTSYYSFRAEYAELIDLPVRNRPRPVRVVTGYKNLERLRAAMTKYGTIINSEDCLDLPEKIYEKYYVDLTDEQRVHYESIRKRSLTVLENQSIVSVKIALTKIMRLQQIVCGFVNDDDGTINPIKHNRLEALDAILDEVRGKVIIWTQHRFCIREIENYLINNYGKEYVVSYYGDTDQEDRDIAKAAFKAGSKSNARFLVGNPQVGGYGLNLTGANTVIFYSNSFDNEIRRQAEKRAHRIGQTRTVTYVDLVGTKTVDEKIIDALRSKTDLVNLVTASNWREFF